MDATLNLALLYLDSDAPRAEQLLREAAAKGNLKAKELMVEFRMISGMTDQVELKPAGGSSFLGGDVGREDQEEEEEEEEDEEDMFERRSKLFSSPGDKGDSILHAQQYGEESDPEL